MVQCGTVLCSRGREWRGWISRASRRDVEEVRERRLVCASLRISLFLSLLFLSHFAPPPFAYPRIVFSPLHSVHFIPLVVALAGRRVRSVEFFVRSHDARSRRAESAWNRLISLPVWRRTRQKNAIIRRGGALSRACLARRVPLLLTTRADEALAALLNSARPIMVPSAIESRGSPLRSEKSDCRPRSDALGRRRENAFI